MGSSTNSTSTSSESSNSKQAKYLNYESQMKNEDFSNLQIIKIHKNHCYLYNNFTSFLGSVFTVPLTGNSLTHDWIVLEVKENVKKNNI